MAKRWTLSRLVLLALAGGVIAWAAIAGRGLVGSWTRARVRDQMHARVHALRDAQASQFVRELAVLDADAPAVIVPLLADPREPVAAAAEQTLRRLVEDWQRLPADQANHRFGMLAHELAAWAARLPAPRGLAARDLAARVLVSPLDPGSPRAAQILADCELVLRQPIEYHEVVRVAAAPPARTEPPSIPAVQPVPAAPPVVVAAPAAVMSDPHSAPEPRIYGAPLEPERLIDASQERSVEPRQLRRPKAMKIEG